MKLKSSRVVSLALRALARLLRPLPKLLPSPSLPKLPELGELPHLGQTLKRLRPGWSSSGTGRKREIAAPHQADLPAALAQAAGLPIQHATLVAVPGEIACNQFTQFEDFPTIMSAVANVDQIDPAQVEFELRHWGGGAAVEPTSSTSDLRTARWSTRTSTSAGSPAPATARPQIRTRRATARGSPARVRRPVARGAEPDQRQPWRRSN